MVFHLCLCQEINFPMVPFFLKCFPVETLNSGLAWFWPGLLQIWMGCHWAGIVHMSDLSHAIKTHNLAHTGFLIMGKKTFFFKLKISPSSLLLLKFFSLSLSLSFLNRHKHKFYPIFYLFSAHLFPLGPSNLTHSHQFVRCSINHFKDVGFAF